MTRWLYWLAIGSFVQKAGLRSVERPYWALHFSTFKTIWVTRLGYSIVFVFLQQNASDHSTWCFHNYCPCSPVLCFGLLFWKVFSRYFCALFLCSLSLFVTMPTDHPHLSIISPWLTCVYIPVCFNCVFCRSLFFLCVFLSDCSLGSCLWFVHLFQVWIISVVVSNWTCASVWILTPFHPCVHYRSKWFTQRFSDGVMKLCEAPKLSTQLYHKKVHYEKLFNTVHTNDISLKKLSLCLRRPSHFWIVSDNKSVCAMKTCIKLRKYKVYINKSFTCITLHMNNWVCE